MIVLLESPEIEFTRDVQHVYRPAPLPGDSEEAWAEYRRDWGRPTDIRPAATARLSVRLNVEFDRDSKDLIESLRCALRDVLMAAGK